MFCLNCRDRGVESPWRVKRRSLAVALQRRTAQVQRTGTWLPFRQDFRLAGRVAEGFTKAKPMAPYYYLPEASASCQKYVWGDGTHFPAAVGFTEATSHAREIPSVDASRCTKHPTARRNRCSCWRCGSPGQVACRPNQYLRCYSDLP